MVNYDLTGSFWSNLGRNYQIFRPQDLNLCSISGWIWHPPLEFGRIYCLRRGHEQGGVFLYCTGCVAVAHLRLIRLFVAWNGLIFYLCLVGEVKICDRTDIMMKFNADPKRPQIMLLSLTAGGVGLNLTGANHLFFLDIHWNPQLELQAQDRIHRFGQKRPVTIRRLIVNSDYSSFHRFRGCEKWPCFFVFSDTLAPEP